MEERKTQKRRKATGSKKKRSHKRGRRKNKTLERIIQAVLILGLGCVLFYVIFNFGEANKLNNKGLEAYSKADYETANAYFAKALERDGGSSEYYRNQGMAQSELKLYDEAMASFEKALDLAKGEQERQLANRMKGISLLYQGKYDEALAAFDSALAGKEKRFSDTEVDILYYKAETQEKAGKYVEAVMTYTQIVDAEGTADAYMLRGMAYVKVGDNSSAEADLRTAIKKDKKNYEIYMTLYQALEAQGKQQEAKEVLNDALKLGGKSGEALVNQGRIYTELGEYDTAEEKLTKALDKGETSANLCLAELCMKKPEKDYAAAGLYFEAYLLTVTDDAKAYNEYGLCLMETGNYEKAEQIFTKGVALNDRFIDRTISKNQISAAERAGHWEKALEYVNVYLEKYSDDSDAQREKTFIETRIR